MDIKKYIADGNLNFFVLDLLPAEESAEVARLLSIYEELGEEHERLLILLENFAKELAIRPTQTSEEALQDIFDFCNPQTVNGNLRPPLLEQCHELEPWLIYTGGLLHNADSSLQRNFNVIGYSEKFLQVLIHSEKAFDWPLLKECRESYLILSGDVEMKVEGRTYKMSEGDFFTPPVGIAYQLQVTSPTISIIIERNCNM